MRFIKDVVLENWYLKLLSLILATGLWALISQESVSEVFFAVPLEYQNVPPGTEIIGDSSRNVEVRLRGPSTLIREVAAKDISTVIDLAQMARSGDLQVPLNAQNVHAPFGLSVVQVNPSRVLLSLDQTVSATVHVVPIPQGKTAPGFEVESIALKPDSVKAEGPASHIRTLTSVNTSPIDLSGRKSTFSQALNLDLADPLVRFPSAVSIRAEIRIKKR